MRVGHPPARVFVGRERDLGQLCSALDDALASRGALALVSGDAGVGKTRVAQELSAAAEASGALVLWGRCWQAEASPPLLPWTEILRELWFEIQSGGHLIGDGVGELSRIVPELGPAPEGATGDPDAARFRLYDAVAGLLRREADHRPLLIVLDDLHWADAATLMLLGFVAREADRSRLLLVGTFRDVEMRPDHPLVAWLAELTSDVLRIPLEGLGEEDVALLVEGLVGRSPGAGFVRELWERTGGNPFFVTEIVRFLVRQRGEEAAVGSLPAFFVPRGVRDVIARRLSLLPGAGADVLQAAAVLGVSFELEHLASLLDVAPSKLRTILEPAVLGRLLRPRVGGGYAFDHALVRDALYDTLPEDRRADLHRRAGELLEGLDDPPVSQLVHHFLQAGDSPKASTYALRAAARAMTALAYEEAAASVERCLRTASADARLPLLLALGAAQSASGRTEEARAAHREAFLTARRTGDVDGLAESALGFGAWLQFAGISGSDLELIELLEGALEAVSPQMPVPRCRLLVRLAHELYYLDHERSSAFLREATELGEASDAEELRTLVPECRLNLLYGTERVADRLALADELVRLAEDARLPARALEGRVLRVTELLQLGRLDRLDAEIVAVEREAEAARQPGYLWFPKVWRAMRAHLEGRLEDAESLALEALETGAGRGRIAIDYLGVQLLGIRREQGRLDELVDAVVEAVGEYPLVPAYRCTLAFVQADLGRTAEARGSFERLAADDFAGVPVDFNRTVALAMLAEACALLGDEARAAVLYGLLAPHAPGTITAGWGALCLGSVDRYLGLLSATAGWMERAGAHFETAIEANARLGAIPAVARTRYEYARVLRAGGREADAVPLLAEALTASRELGLTDLVAKIEAVGADVGGIGDRFQREGDLWALAFAGRTVHLPDAKGLRDIASLLASPGREVHVLDLAAATEGHGPAVEASPEEGLSTSGAPEPVIDVAARDAYRRRLAELQEDLDEAELLGDRVRAERARAEMDALTHELSVALGLGGRSRRMPDDAERARKAVARRVRTAIDRIEAVHPQLARHLRNSVRTGAFCVYHPESPHRWAL